MIETVYIIRSIENINKFFKLDTSTGNWDWTTNLEEASIFKTPEKAEQIRSAKITDPSYIYEIPYFIAQPEQRKKKKKTTSVKRKTKTRKK